MFKRWLWILPVSLVGIVWFMPERQRLPVLPSFLHGNRMLTRITPTIDSAKALETHMHDEIDEITHMLQQEPSLHSDVIHKVSTILKCAHGAYMEHPIVTIIDYSLPSNEKRLWIFNLEEKKLLFHTYVSHGINSGALISNLFSNKHDSKASSIGVYATEKAYHGREGLSLALEGLDAGFNDNAANRAIVMHGGWYVDEAFIKKYGRAGRSWGCPALPLQFSESIINTIKDQSLMVIYYPNDQWFLKSKFLKCDTRSLSNQATVIPTEETVPRDEVLLVNYKSSEPMVVAMAADDYMHIFRTNVPLARMLRRQINHMEYVALSTTEFEKMTHDPAQLNAVHFVLPIVKMVRGYAVTEMHLVDFGKIKEITSPLDTSHHYTVYFETKSAVMLRATNQFIRWLGL